MFTTSSRKDWVGGASFWWFPGRAEYSLCLSFQLLVSAVGILLSWNKHWRKLSFFFSSHCSQGHHVFSTWSYFLFSPYCCRARGVPAPGQGVLENARNKCAGVWGKRALLAPRVLFSVNFDRSWQCTNVIYITLPAFLVSLIKGVRMKTIWYEIMPGPGLTSRFLD